MNTYYYHMICDISNNDNFKLHSHDEYEILLFIRGDSYFVVEDKIYSLEPGDVIIVRKHEMHRVYHNSTGEYHRFCCMVSPCFFKDKSCPEYEDVFRNPFDKRGNKISSDIVHSSGLYDAITRLGKYSDSFTNNHTPITDSIIIEILHILHNIRSFTNADEVNKQIKPVLGYINNHFTNDISLDFLSDKFYLSKFYMCRLFKEATGHTIHGYIRNKRLIYAGELIKDGMNMTDAAMKAGFNNYSSFYQAMKKHQT